MTGFINRFTEDSDFIILWIELSLFSVLYGVAFRSWAIFGVIFLVSSWVLNGPQGKVHIIYAMSLLWSFIAFSIGHSISWGWATALGIAFFLLGMGAHLISLKKPVTSIIVSTDRENEWRYAGFRGRQNLN